MVNNMFLFISITIIIFMSGWIAGYLGHMFFRKRIMELIEENKNDKEL